MKDYDETSTENSCGRIRVLWLSHFAPYPPKGGADQRSYNMIKELSGIADITLVALAGRAKVEAFYPTLEQGLLEIELEMKKLCREVILIPHGLPGRSINRIFMAARSLLLRKAYDVECLRSSAFTHALDSILLRSVFEVVHVDTIGMWQYANDLLPLKILNHHNIESHMMERRADKSSLPLRFYLANQANKLRKLESEVCDQAHLNLTCSDLDSKRLQLRASARCEAVPNGVDTDYFSRKKAYVPERPAKLIFVGGLDWYPNKEAVDYFFNLIWPTLQTSLPLATIKIVGRGRNDAAERAASLSDRVVITGFVQDVRPHLEQATIFVCPITDGGGTKLKLLDAFAMGLPVVAHPVASEGIDAIDGVHFLGASSPEEFVAAISKIEQNAELALRLSENARSLIEQKYAYNVIRAQIHRIYKGAACSAASSRTVCI